MYNRASASSHHDVNTLLSQMCVVYNGKLLAASGAADPPVCRLLNHSQVSYEAKVKERKAEKKQHENRKLATIKEVSFSLFTSLVLLLFSCSESAVSCTICPLDSWYLPCTSVTYQLS